MRYRLVLFRWLCFVWLSGLSGLALQAQPTPLSEAAATRQAVADSLLGFHLAPLDTLMARALANAPEIKGQAALIDSRKATLRVQKKVWTKLIQPYVGVNYGTGTVLANVDDGTVVSSNFATRQQLLYNVGVNFRLTGEDFINRKGRCQTLEYEIDKLGYDGNTLERLIRERVIMRYEELIKAAEVMLIKAQQMHTNAMNWELAERYFHAGDMSYADYNGVLDDKLHSQMQFINIKSDFQKHYLLLREVVGGPLD